MPVYNEEEFKYELLLRFGDTDPNKGKLVGASLSTITQTTKDGVPLPGGTVVNPPKQLALLEGEDGESLSDILGKVNAETIVQNQVMRNTFAEYESHVNATIQGLNDQLAAANAEIKRLNALVTPTEDATTEQSDTSTEQGES